MKINEIIMEAPGQSGQNPALQSEAQRAQVEYRTLKKFSPQFANEFMQSFRLLGSNSVDAAYQAAAEKAGLDPRKAKEISNADAGSQEQTLKVWILTQQNTVKQYRHFEVLSLMHGKKLKLIIKHLIHLLVVIMVIKMLKNP